MTKEIDYKLEYEKAIKMIETLTNLVERKDKTIDKLIGDLNEKDSEIDHLEYKKHAAETRYNKLVYALFDLLNKEGEYNDR